MEPRKIYRAEAIQLVAVRTKRTVRKHLNVDALIKSIREDFRKISDHRAENTKISLDDALMSAFAMFHLKEILPCWLSTSGAGENRKIYIPFTTLPTFPVTAR